MNMIFIFYMYIIVNANYLYIFSLFVMNGGRAQLYILKYVVETLYL